MFFTGILRRLGDYTFHSGNFVRIILAVIIEALSHSHEGVSVLGSWGRRHPRSGKMIGYLLKNRGRCTP